MSSQVEKKDIRIGGEEGCEARWRRRVSGLVEKKGVKPGG